MIRLNEEQYAAREAARAAGKKTYSPAIPCGRGHTERYVNHGTCIGCRRLRDKEQPRRRTNDQARAIRTNHPDTYLLKTATSRARKRGLEMTLKKEDLTIPSHCPVFGTPMKLGTMRDRDASLSLDRLNPRKGYTPENTRVISWRANRIKSDATLEELKAIVAYLEREQQIQDLGSSSPRRREPDPASERLSAAPSFSKD